MSGKTHVALYVWEGLGIRDKGGARSLVLRGRTSEGRFNGQEPLLPTGP